MLTLPATPIAQAHLIVERMLVSVRKARPLREHPDFQYTFSGGIACVQAGDTALTLYARADRALYMAKLTGRDRIHADDSSPDRSAGAG